MTVCPQCGGSYDDRSKFCPFCGAKNTLSTPEEHESFQQPEYSYKQPEYQQPATPDYSYQPPEYQQPATPDYSYQQPVQHAELQVSGGTKVKGFIGMGLGIGALFMGVLTVILGFCSFASLECAILAITYGIVTLALAIPAKILSAKSISGGFRSKAPSLGNVFGLIGIICGGVGFFFGLIGTML